MALSFSASPSGLSLTPPSITGGSTNATRYGNAVNLGNIWKANRDGGFDPSSFVAQDTASSALEQSSAMQADANAYATSLGAQATVSQAKKRADELKAAAKKSARKGIFGSALGAVVGIGATALTGNPMIGMAAAQGGKAVGGAIG